MNAAEDEFALQSAMLAENLEPAVTRLPFLRLTAIGVLVATAFVLTGCGRKGPLDPPPGAWVTPPGTTPIREGQQPASQPDFGPDGKPIAPAGPNRRLPGDWLID